MLIDFRSDTITKPTPAMLQFMLNASVGDDVFCEDPSVNELEQLAADLFGMQAALYSPTGTMSNQIGIKCHTQPGDEVICEKSSHVYQYEGGGIAFNSGAQVKPIDGIRGQITAKQIEAAINPDDVHKARTSLVSLENTCNRGGGSCYSLDEIKKISNVCRQHNLALHLDGARLFNALVAQQQTPNQFGELFDSISICLNKGLGCPMGSILLGKTAYIQKARRIRKVLGGGMRQAGYMAASGIYALQHHIQRLHTDHTHAKLLATALEKQNWISNLLPVETNIVIAEMKAPFKPAAIVEQLALHQIRTFSISATQLRFVTHLNISEEMVHEACAVFNKLSP
jgi:threonine aldolase